MSMRKDFLKAGSSVVKHVSRTTVRTAPQICKLVDRGMEDAVVLMNAALDDLESFNAQYAVRAALRKEKGINKAVNKAAKAGKVVVFKKSGRIILKDMPESEPKAPEFDIEALKKKLRPF